MLYKYVAVDRNGKFERGDMEAPSQRIVSERLREANLLIVSIKRKKARQVDMKNLLRQFRSVTFLDRVMITKYMSVMIKAGVNVSEALDVLKEQTPSLQLKKVLGKIIESVRDGRRLSDSFGMFPKIFPELYINVIRAGEESGTLEENLNRLSDQLERDYELRRNVISAMFYPIMVMVVTLIMGVGLAWFVLPKVTQLFKSFDMDLPVSTRVLLWAADVIENHGLLALAVMGGSITLLIVLSKLKASKPFTHRMSLGIPIFGRILQNMNLARFSRILSSLLKSGLTINESLKIVSETLSNIPYRKSLGKVVKDIEKGNKVSDSLRGEARLFPPVVHRTINVGEQSGNLEEVLMYLAEFYEQEVNTATKNLATVIEPLMLIGIGLVLGGIAISIISPIYQISGAVGGP